MKRKKRKEKKTKERSKREREREREKGRQRWKRENEKEMQGRAGKRRGGKKSEEDRCVALGAAKRGRDFRAAVSAGGGNLATSAAH